jgi:hypothetical protein
VFELPDGLQWSSQPAASEHCSSTAASVQCETRTFNPANDNEFDGWAWKVRAKRPGSYLLSAAITDMSAADTRPSDNTSSLTVVTTAAVSAGPARVTPARPKAGAPVTVRVQVRAGATLVRPRAVVCSASIGAIRLRGRPQASSGAATCTFRTPTGANGKRLRGRVEFRVHDTRVTRPFAATLS